MKPELLSAEQLERLQHHLDPNVHALLSHIATLSGQVEELERKRLDFKFALERIALLSESLVSAKHMARAALATQPTTKELGK